METAHNVLGDDILRDSVQNAFAAEGERGVTLRDDVVEGPLIDSRLALGDGFLQLPFLPHVSWHAMVLRLDTGLLASG